MPIKLLRDPQPEDPEHIKLRRDLDHFYATTTDYKAFSDQRDDHRRFHALIVSLLQTFKGQPRLKVLELGAGRPTFPQNLGPLREAVEYHAQDVTPINQAYMSEVAEQVFISDISQIEGQYDLIFSTFVLEHVSAPREFLRHIDRLLKPGGYHVMICPRYDLPGYVCPSLRHLSRGGRIRASIFLAMSRFFAFLGGAPRFWVVADPAVFHGKWFRDADAVHLVSRLDIERWHRAHGFSIHRLYPPVKDWREWLFMRRMLLLLACRKNG